MSLSHRLIHRQSKTGWIAISELSKKLNSKSGVFEIEPKSFHLLRRLVHLSVGWSRIKLVEHLKATIWLICALRQQNAGRALAASNVLMIDFEEYDVVCRGALRAVKWENRMPPEGSDILLLKNHRLIKA